MLGSSSSSSSSSSSGHCRYRWCWIVTLGCVFCLSKCTAFAASSRSNGGSPVMISSSLTPLGRRKDRRRSSVVTWSSKEEEEMRGGDVDQQPSWNQLRNFYGPCLALWISGPLLSLVDTASVGLSAAAGEGAKELGSLGPATTFIDGATYLFAFLNVATTNLYANALARNEDGSGVVRTAAKIALLCGTGLTILLLTAGRSLLELYIGGDVGGVLDKAVSYVGIRAWSMPTSLLGGVLQAALLGSKDSVTPLIAVAYSTVCNVVGDGICVFGMKMGTDGAAIATLLAQWAGTAAMIGPARRKLFATTNSPVAKVSSLTFLKFAAPVLTLILGKLAAFGVMTHVAAALPGEATLAAHQITLSLFLFVSPFLEVISQTAQAFLPQFLTSNNEHEAGILSWRLLKMGLAIAGGVACLASSIPRFFPFILSNDLVVHSAVRPLALPLAISALLTAPVAVSEGILLARRQLKYLASIYVISTLLFPFGLFTIKKSQGPVVNVWWGFALFQLFRALSFTGKLWGPQLFQKIFPSKNKKPSPA